MSDASASQRHDRDARGLEPAAQASRSDRDASLRALQILEDALAAPAPRRERTWLHRVTHALDALAEALDAQARTDSESMSILSEIALTEPRYVTRVERLRAEHQDLRVAVAALRERLAPDPEVHVDASEIRDRLANLARQFRQHRAREADLVYEAVNIDLGFGD